LHLPLDIAELNHRHLDHQPHQDHRLRRRRPVILAHEAGVVDPEHQNRGCIRRPARGGRVDDRESVEEGIEMTEEPIYSQEGEIEKEIKEHSQEPIEAPEELDKNSEVKLKLHESLLPVKNDKDKKLVREYFSKIFNVLSKDLRDQIKELNIPKKERKELLKELAFLNKQEQEKYIRAIIDLYKELPIKLIERIRKLPNIKPQYYEKVIEQLKFMDDEEQLEFVHFLEKNA